MDRELSPRQSELLAALLKETTTVGSATIARLSQLTGMPTNTARASMRSLQAYGYAEQLYVRGPYRASKNLDGAPLAIDVTIGPAGEATGTG